MQSAVEPLALAIALGVVRRCSGLPDVIHLAEFLDDVRLKVSPLVAIQLLWHPKPLEPLLDQHSHHSCLLVSGWDGLREFGEDICQDEDIVSAFCCLLTHIEVLEEEDQGPSVAKGFLKMFQNLLPFAVLFRWKAEDLLPSLALQIPQQEL